jgi:broad specificity phosphatase PhoE
MSARFTVRIMSTVEFIFLRHAQATHNVDAEKYGDAAYFNPIHRDAELTGFGRHQTTEVGSTRGEELAAADVIYCSPLVRCRDTLLGVMPSAASREVRIDDRLMEPQSHVCNHRKERKELLDICPDAWSLEGVSEVNPRDAPVSITKWIRAFTADMLARHRGQRVLVVTHCTWIRNWFRIFKRENVVPNNCEIRITSLPAHEKLD